MVVENFENKLEQTLQPENKLITKLQKEIIDEPEHEKRITTPAGGFFRTHQIINRNLQRLDPGSVAPTQVPKINPF